jgi:hypothetical protein
MILGPALSVLLLAMAPAAAGEAGRGDWEIGPYAGLGSLDDYEATLPLPLAFVPDSDPQGNLIVRVFYGSSRQGIKPKDAILYGARAGFFFHRPWSLEASYQHLGTRTGLGRANGLPDADASLDSLRLNLLYNFPGGGDLRPFLTVGSGRESFEADDIVFSPQLSGAGTVRVALVDASGIEYNAGFGVRWSAGERFGLRMDARLVLADLDELEERQQNIEATIGANWTLGRR